MTPTASVEKRQCSACGRFHPPPWDNKCPSKIAKDASNKYNISEEEIKKIFDFCTSLNNVLLECENREALIFGINKLIELKGIKGSKKQ